MTDPIKLSRSPTPTSVASSQRAGLERLSAANVAQKPQEAARVSLQSSEAQSLLRQAETGKIRKLRDIDEALDFALDTRDRISGNPEEALAAQKPSAEIAARLF